MRKVDVATRSFDGTGDLVVMAPLRDGFIDAFETVTFETRARMAAEALNNIRLNAREFETLMPYSDTTERILNILDFRLGVIDKDWVQFDGTLDAEPRRYLFLVVTFDSGWEPYMRLIWKPLGAFLDVFFCNCEGYRPAGDHGFEAYIDWVRKAQVESSIFYSASGLTVSDQRYFKAMDRAQNDPRVTDRDGALARLVPASPIAEAAQLRQTYQAKAVQVGLEALNVLYKLADLYPVDRVDPQRYPPAERTVRNASLSHAEGRYLLRAALVLLEGFDAAFEAVRQARPATAATLEAIYADPLRWYRTDRALLASREPLRDDPTLDNHEIQAGILSPFEQNGRPASEAALLLMTIQDARQARNFIAGLPVSYEGSPPPAGDCFRTIALTASGLRRIGLPRDRFDRFPKEFRDGMEIRSGILGDMRENHPRNWILPERNWPPADPASPPRPRPPIETGEIDLVIQLRRVPSSGETGDALLAEIQRIADQASASGVALAGFQRMAKNPAPDADPGATVDHFGFRDGLSQPQAVANAPSPDRRTGADRDKIRLGELLYGYANDRGDQAADHDGGDSGQNSLSRLLHNSTFLVVRKIEQHRDVFDQWAETTCTQLNDAHGLNGTGDALTPAMLKAKLVGRWQDGAALIGSDRTSNDFDFAGDGDGAACPLASHVRRCNPRQTHFDRPDPRILRRGMSFSTSAGGAAGTAPQRGLMFMAYSASIAEQYEVIQRWINGGNSTGIPSMHSDPLLGVAPAHGQHSFTFLHAGKVMRCLLPVARMADRAAGISTEQPGFTRLHWGAYLWVPSRTAITTLCAQDGPVAAIDQADEAAGTARIDRLSKLPADRRAMEWKRILENFDTKDPTEQAISPDIWASVRGHHGGALRLDPGRNRRATILVASSTLARQVLSDAALFSSHEQMARMKGSFGSNYVAMDAGESYWSESGATNAIMYAQNPQEGFATGYAAAAAVLATARAFGRTLGQSQIKFDLRRQFLMPTLGAMCQHWFGLPGSDFMDIGGLDWSSDRKARCPGDFISSSRYIFNPDPSEALKGYGRDHGRKIRRAGLAFVRHYRGRDAIPGTLARPMFDAIADDDLLARNITGMMLGMLAPIEANLRGILLEWLSERSLWMHQAALWRASGDAPADHASASAALGNAIAEAMCKRPAPDLLYRRATADCALDTADSRAGAATVRVRRGDMVIVSLVSVSQASLHNAATGSAQGLDTGIIFGGGRKPDGTGCPYPRADGGAWPSADQPTGRPVHACPARKLMTGAMTGILAALLDAGRIQAMPAGLVIGLDT